MVSNIFYFHPYLGEDSQKQVDENWKNKNTHYLCSPFWETLQIHTFKKGTWTRKRLEPFFWRTNFQTVFFRLFDDVLFDCLQDGEFFKEKKHRKTFDCLVGDFFTFDHCKSLWTTIWEIFAWDDRKMVKWWSERFHPKIIYVMSWLRPDSLKKCQMKSRGSWTKRRKNGITSKIHPVRGPPSCQWDITHY